MLTQTPIQSRNAFLPDLLIVLGFGAFIYGIFLFGGQWQASYNPSYEIDLSLSTLPLYSLFSAMRGLAAYVLSLGFTLVVGYWAAKSKRAERVILPILDIMQSIPVLGFLPGLVLGLVALFPHSNVGLELAAVIMIFTGQVWNMTFAYYSSLKSVPGDMQEAASIMGLSKITRLIKLEIPFSSVNLVWNSIMSMAGGWFFLTVCEAFTLGEKQYRLPGIGAYMAVAIEKGDSRAMVFGVLAMAIVIIAMDTLIWRPLLAWVHRYRLEDTVSPADENQLVYFIFTNSRFLRLLKKRSIRRGRRSLFTRRRSRVQLRWNPSFHFDFGQMINVIGKWIRWPLFFAVAAGMILGSIRLVTVLAHLPLLSWLTILYQTSATFLRVICAIAIGTVWAVPAGIWIAQTQRRLQIAQPIAQLLASFPAPMLYPLVVGVMFWLKVDFSIVAMVLMLLGVQWYILFNTLAGGLRIPKELGYTMDLTGNSRRDRWRYLFLPSVFPSLVTGWVTAAGGAWNASIVAEYITYKGHIIQTPGLGSLISQSAEKGDFQMLSACLVVMVAVVVLLNRLIWDRIYKVAQTRFRLDL